MTVGRVPCLSIRLSFPTRSCSSLLPHEEGRSSRSVIWGKHSLPRKRLFILLYCQWQWYAYCERDHGDCQQSYTHTHTHKGCIFTYKPARIQYMISKACKGGRYHNVLLIAVIMIIAGVILVVFFILKTEKGF